MARKYEYEDNYPHELIEKMKEIGLVKIYKQYLKKVDSLHQKKLVDTHKYLVH